MRFGSTFFISFPSTKQQLINLFVQLKTEAEKLNIGIRSRSTPVRRLGFTSKAKFGYNKKRVG